MLQPKAYPEMIGKALFLDADPFVTMVDDDNPWAEGLFLIVSVGVAVGFAQLVGNLLMTASLPTPDAVLELMLNAWAQLGNSLGLASNPEQAASVRNYWTLATQFSGYAGAWSRFVVVLGVPVGLLLFWLLYGGICHVVAMFLGGSGQLSQTLGALALLVAPQVLKILTAVPFVSVSGLLIGVWSLLIVYRAVEVAHDLPWERAAIAAVTPLVVLLLAGLATVSFVGFFLLAFGG